MRKCHHSVILALSLAILPAAHAKRPPAVHTEPDKSALVEHGHYRNKRGDDVHSPAHTKDGKAPTGASAKCSDGSYSFSTSRSDTCSGHHGVTAWLN